MDGSLLWTRFRRASMCLIYPCQPLLWFICCVECRCFVAVTNYYFNAQAVMKFTFPRDGEEEMDEV